MNRVRAVAAAAVLVLSTIAILPVAAATASGPTVIANIEVGVGSEPYFTHWLPGVDAFSVSDYGAGNVSFVGAENQTVYKNVTVQSEPAGQELLTPNGPANQGNLLWVADRSSDNVSVINLTTYTVTHTIPVGVQPIGIAYDSANNTVWVANWGGHNLTVLNATTYAHVRSVTVGTAPIYPYFDADTNTMAVADWTTGDFRLIGGSNYTTYDTVTGLNEPSAIASSEGPGSYHEFFVSDYGSHTTTVISHVNGQIVANISVGSDPYGDGWDNQTGDQFVANSGGSTVSVVSAASNSVTATITVGSHPYSAQGYDARGGLILVANYGSGNVSIISDSTGGSAAAAAAALTASLLLIVIAVGLLAIVIAATSRMMGRRGA